MGTALAVAVVAGGLAGVLEAEALTLAEGLTAGELRTALGDRDGVADRDFDGLTHGVWLGTACRVRVLAMDGILGRPVVRVGKLMFTPPLAVAVGDAEGVRDGWAECDALGAVDPHGTGSVAEATPP